VSAASISVTDAKARKAIGPKAENRSMGLEIFGFRQNDPSYVSMWCKQPF
jgi:hypothetical protein